MNSTIQLQGIGKVKGTPASDIKVGNTLKWNFGTTSIVTKIIKETPKSIWIEENINDKLYQRQFLKTRLVCIV